MIGGGWACRCVGGHVGRFKSKWIGRLVGKHVCIYASKKENKSTTYLG
jgi:hypothetical protein